MKFYRYIFVNKHKHLPLIQFNKKELGSNILMNIATSLISYRGTELSERLVKYSRHQRRVTLPTAQYLLVPI